MTELLTLSKSATMDIKSNVTHKAAWTKEIFKCLVQLRRSLIKQKEAEAEVLPSRKRRKTVVDAFVRSTGHALKHELEQMFGSLVGAGAVRPCPCSSTREMKDRLRFDPKCACGGSGYLPCNGVATENAKIKEVQQL